MDNIQYLCVNWSEKTGLSDWDNDIPRLLGEAIRDSNLDENSRKILLNYPVVYIHCWEEDQPCVYVGETIDPFRRTSEHVNAGDTPETWQEKWRQGANQKSYYFSHEEMNKSLALDLEAGLIEYFKSPEGPALCCVNDKKNPQNGYSNKDKRNALLNKILEILGFKQQNVDNASAVLCAASFPENEELAVFCGKIDHNSKMLLEKDKLKTSIQKQVKPAQEQLLLEYPVVYMHIWKKDELIHVYTGETTNLIKRTEQHLKGERIKEDPDAGIEEDNWHSEWQKADIAVMLVFGHRTFNTSVTRDIENLLIDYFSIQNLSVNGRANPQFQYSGRETMHKYFCQIVNYLNEYKSRDGCALKELQLDKTRFPTLSELRDQASHLASPFLAFSEEQRTAIDQIRKKIASSCETQAKHTVIVVCGGVGTGKTAIAFRLYTELLSDKEKQIAFLVNHKELFRTYSEQFKAHSLASDEKEKGTIRRPTEWINEIAADYQRRILQLFDPTKQRELQEHFPEKEPAKFKEFFAEFTNKNSWNPSQSGQIPDIDKRNTYYWANIKTMLEWAKGQSLDMGFGPDKPLYDVTLVDEAHLLQAGGGGGSVYEAQLPIIVENSRLTVLMFDPLQFVANNQRWEFRDDDIGKVYQEFLRMHGLEDGIEVVTLELTQQFRMNCSDTTSEWIRGLFRNPSCGISKFPYNQKKVCYEYGFRVKNNNKIHFVRELDENGEQVYEIGVFTSATDLANFIERKKGNEIPSCMLATYCWPWDPPRFRVQSLKCQWHNTSKGDEPIWTRNKTMIIKDKKTEEKFCEVGAYHDIQGFDLKYAGVILGESVKLSKDRRSIKLNADSGGRIGISKNTRFWELLIQNEIGILLTRGINGLYLYVVNEGLRNMLIDAILIPEDNQ